MAPEVNTEIYSVLCDNQTADDPEDVPMAVNADGEMVPIKMDVGK